MRELLLQNASVLSEDLRGVNDLLIVAQRLKYDFAVTLCLTRRYSSRECDLRFRSRLRMAPRVRANTSSNLFALD